MKAYRVEILIIDHDKLGPDEIKVVLENQKYPNWCIYPIVKRVDGAELGEWTDDHPLNRRSTSDAEYRRLFSRLTPEP